jgi:hypothetical protein
MSIRQRAVASKEEEQDDQAIKFVEFLPICVCALIPLFDAAKPPFLVAHAPCAATVCRESVKRFAQSLKEMDLFPKLEEEHSIRTNSGAIST